MGVVHGAARHRRGGQGGTRQAAAVAAAIGLHPQQGRDADLAGGGAPVLQPTQAKVLVAVLLQLGIPTFHSCPTAVAICCCGSDLDPAATSAASRAPQVGASSPATTASPAAAVTALGCEMLVPGRQAIAAATAAATAGVAVAADGATSALLLILGLPQTLQRTAALGSFPMEGAVAGHEQHQAQQHLQQWAAEVGGGWRRRVAAGGGGGWAAAASTSTSGNEIMLITMPSCTRSPLRSRVHPWRLPAIPSAQGACGALQEAPFQIFDVGPRSGCVDFDVSKALL